MTTDFEERVRAVNWSSYQHPCGQNQARIPALLLQMIQGKEEQMKAAAIELWDVAAHQGCTGPSAVPVAEFILELLAGQPPLVQVENLDTLYQFSNSLTEKHWTDWSPELKKAFAAGLPLLESLSRDSNEDLADFSNGIVENFRSSEPAETHPVTSDDD